MRHSKYVMFQVPNNLLILDKISSYKVMFVVTKPITANNACNPDPAPARGAPANHTAMFVSSHNRQYPKRCFYCIATGYVAATTGSTLACIIHARLITAASAPVYPRMGTLPALCDQLYGRSSGQFVLKRPR